MGALLVLFAAGFGMNAQAEEGIGVNCSEMPEGKLQAACVVCSNEGRFNGAECICSNILLDGDIEQNEYGACVKIVSQNFLRAPACDSPLANEDRVCGGRDPQG